MASALPPVHPLPPSLRFLDGGGEATRLILARDWSDHVLGPPAGWPDTLKVTLGTVLNSPESMILAWGRDELSFFFNDTYAPLLGPRLPWAMGTRFRDVWADGWEQAKPIIDDAFAGHRQRFTDLPWKLGTDRGPAETWFTFSYSRILDPMGEVAGLFVFTNETTGRVLADRALSQSQSDLRALNATLEQRVRDAIVDRDRTWGNSRDLLVVLDDTGTFRAANPAWTTVLGWSEQELVGRSYLDIIHPDDHPSSAQALVTASSQALPTYENRYRHRDGGYRTISWVAAPEGQLIYASGRDITDERDRDAELASAQEALRQAQKMEAVGQLTGGLAHDFNNLLTGMMGNLELLQLRIARGRVDDLDRFIVAAQGAGRRAAALTQRLLAFSRRQTLAPKPTDADRLIAGMEEIIDRTLGPGIEVKVVSAAGLWPILVDAPQLESALLNLCINARDAMPEGGLLTIETGNKVLDLRAAAAQDLPPGEYVSLCVTDTGTGMPPEVIERVFDPFFTTKPIG